MNHQHAAPTAAAVPSVGQSEVSTGIGHPPGINGTDHHDDIAQRITPSATAFSATPVTQPEPVAAAPQPVKAPSPPAETQEEKVEEPAEPAREPEPTPAPEPAPVKRAPEPAPSQSVQNCMKHLSFFKLYYLSI